MKNNMIEKLNQIVGNEHVLVDEPMKKHITFRVGGPADYYVSPTEVSQIAEVMQLCKEEQVPYFVLGNGSNLLVSDQGYRGVVIQIYKNMNQIHIDGCRIKAQAGILLSQIAKKALEAGLTGFEFASGIPGTLGGAAVMNAGAYGGEMKDVLVSCEHIDKNGIKSRFSGDELNLSYRHSVYSDSSYLITSLTLKLNKGNKDEIKAKMDELMGKRIDKQPLDYPSAGSTFKRPEGYFAGALIEQCGLKGYQLGGARVSEKHAGFVINADNATSKDVLDLINHCQKTVYDETGVTLETEVKII